MTRRIGNGGRASLCAVVVKGATRSLSKKEAVNLSLTSAKSGSRVTADIAREGDPVALEFLRDYARGARKATGTGMKVNVPDDFHAFVWDYFIDGPPKARPGAKLQETLLRNMIIKALVKVVSDEFRLDKTRNKSRHEHKRQPALGLCNCCSGNETE